LEHAIVEGVAGAASDAGMRVKPTVLMA